jgi:MFS family permease
MFFFHERTIRVNIWAFSFILGPFFGPFLSAFLLEKINWRADYGVLAGLYGFSLLLVILIGDETLYNHKNPNRQPYPTGIKGHVEKLTGIAGSRMTGRPSLVATSLQILKLAIRPEVILVSK